jgi:hypothetical protein
MSRSVGWAARRRSRAIGRKAVAIASGSNRRKILLDPQKRPTPPKLATPFKIEGSEVDAHFGEDFG